MAAVHISTHLEPFGLDQLEGSFQDVRRPNGAGGWRTGEAQVPLLQGLAAAEGLATRLAPLVPQRFRLSLGHHGGSK